VTDLWHFSEDPSLGRFVPRGRQGLGDRYCTPMIERVEVGDLLMRHAEAGNELRIAPVLYPLWDKVIEITLEFSGIRLRNAVRQ